VGDTVPEHVMSRIMIHSKYVGRYFRNIMICTVCYLTDREISRNRRRGYYIEISETAYYIIRCELLEIKRAHSRHPVLK